MKMKSIAFALAIVPFAAFSAPSEKPVDPPAWGVSKPHTHVLPERPVNVQGGAVGQTQSVVDAGTTSVTVNPSTVNSAVTITSNIPDDQKIRNTPSVFNGALTSSLDTCLGSAQGGIATPGFGFSVGGTSVDKNCVMRKNADLLHRMGMSAAALALVCAEDASIKSALERTGFKCPE